VSRTLRGQPRGLAWCGGDGRSEARRGQSELLDAIIALGNRYTKYLGLLTPPAYRKHAEDDGLLVAMDGEEVVGYALFGLPKRSLHVRLAHLCPGSGFGLELLWRE